MGARQSRQRHGASAGGTPPLAREAKAAEGGGDLQCKACPAAAEIVVQATHATDNPIGAVEATAVVVEGEVCQTEAYGGGLQRTSGVISLYRCRCCNGYVNRAEFDTTCRYHPGRFVGRGGPLAPPRHWSCCQGTTPDAPPCAKRPTHTEDTTFTDLARQLGCEMTEAQRASRVESLKEQFGSAFDGRAIRVAVQKSSGTVVIRVPAPPTPTIAHVKAILRSDHPHFAGRHVQLGAAPVRPLHPVVPFDDSLPLGQMRPFEKRKTLHPAQLTEDGALSIFVLESNIRDEKSGTAARGSDWVKVPLHPGDSLAKLSLIHNLDVATLKAANSIIGSEIEGWRDEIWLPPLASLRPAPKTGKVDYVARFRASLRSKTMASAGAGAALERVETEEALSYLSMFENDVEAAVTEYLADEAWAAQARRKVERSASGSSRGVSSTSLVLRRMGKAKGTKLDARQERAVGAMEHSLLQGQHH